MSYFESKKLREERAGLVSQMNEIAQTVQAQSRAMDSSEIEKFDKLDNAQKTLLAQIESAERVESLNVSAGSANAEYVRSASALANKYSEKWNQRDNDLAVRAIICRNAGLSVSDECERAALRLGVNLNTSVINTRDQSVGTDSAGGYGVVSAGIAGISEAMKAYGGIKAISYNLNTASGNPIPILQSDDTANEGAVKAELAATTSTDFAYGLVNLTAHRVSTAVFKISNELISDSSFNIMGHITKNLAIRLWRKEEALFATGTGSGQPHGVVAQATDSGVVTASNTAITYAELMAASHSLDPAYRANARWVMSDLTLSKIKLMVDTTGRPMYSTGLAYAEPDTLLGKPVTICQHMDSITGSAKKCMLFGDFSENWVRTVGGIEIQILKELYALNNAIGVVANTRVDSKLANPAAVKFITSKT